MGVKKFDEFADMAEEAEIMIPSYGLKVLWGVDKDGDYTLCATHVGTIEGITLIGLLETLKKRLLEA